MIGEHYLLHLNQSRLARARFPMLDTNVFALISDWLILFVGLVVIGKSYNFGFGFTILN